MATLINDANTKNLYDISDKLNYPKIGATTYLSLLKRFIHKIKIHLIHPILVNDNFVADIFKKTLLFNYYL